MLFWLAHGELGWTDEISTVVAVIVMGVFLFSLWRGNRRDRQQNQANEETTEASPDQNITVD